MLWSLGLNTLRLHSQINIGNWSKKEERKEVSRQGQGFKGEPLLHRQSGCLFNSSADHHQMHMYPLQKVGVVLVNYDSYVLLWWVCLCTLWRWEVRWRAGLGFFPWHFWWIHIIHCQLQLCLVIVTWKKKASKSATLGGGITVSQFHISMSVSVHSTGWSCCHYQG